MLRSRFSERPDQYNQFVREGKFGCTLRHANIVRIDEVVSHGRMHFFVMEFIEGRNLRDFVKIRKKLHPLEATRLMLDIIEGLRYAFDHGLTHRDLKMSNVLVSSRGQAKLVDFGLASIDETLSDDELDRLPNPRTIDYAALERATGVRKDDTRSDIYFLGCIYYNMLTGMPPLPETRDRIQRLSKQRFMDVVPIRKADPTIPHCVSMVVSKAMQLDPARRYQNPSVMLNDLEIASSASDRDVASHKRGTVARRHASGRRRFVAFAAEFPPNGPNRNGRGIGRPKAGQFPQEFQKGRRPGAFDQRSKPGAEPAASRFQNRRLFDYRRGIYRTARFGIVQ